MNLSTTYLGLELRSPIIAGASNLTADPDNLKKLEDAGVGAVVLKSLFEEQIELEAFKFDEEQDKYDNRHPMMINVFPNLEYAGPREHYMYAKHAKKSVSVPVIASLNAVKLETWVEYAQQLAETGVDALELNFYSSPRGFDETSYDIETQQLDVLARIKAKVKLPIAVKLSSFYSNPLSFIKKLDALNTEGVVLFNRMFDPDIDADEESHIFPFNLSHVNDHRLPLRFAGLLHGNVNTDICCGTGIFSGEDVAKMILAGGDCVQVVSALYRHKIPHVRIMVAELSDWMAKHGYSSLSDFRGKLSHKNLSNPWIYTRAQYANLLMTRNPLGSSTAI